MSTVTSVTTTLRRRRGLTEEAAVAAVDQACRRLRLPTMRALLGDAVAAAMARCASATEASAACVRTFSVAGSTMSRYTPPSGCTHWPSI